MPALCASFVDELAGEFAVSEGSHRCVDGEKLPLVGDAFERGLTRRAISLQQRKAASGLALL